MSDVSGACFADFGHRVSCVDGRGQDRRPQCRQDADREPGLEGLVKFNVDHGRLTFTKDVVEAVKGAEAVFIAVGTPARRGDGHADLTFVFEAVRELAKVIEPGTVVVTKSTVPVDTGDKIEEIPRRGSSGSLGCLQPRVPARRRGIADFKHPDRIIVGAEDDHAQHVLREIYRPLFLNRAPILITSRRTAELTKYAANAFLAVKISFINEIADLCEAVDADVQDVARNRPRQSHRPQTPSARPGHGGTASPRTRFPALANRGCGGRRAADRPHGGGSRSTARRPPHPRFAEKASLGKAAIAGPGMQLELMSRPIPLSAFCNSHRVEITVDGKTERHRVLQILIVNSPYYGWALPIVPNADMTDGELDVAIFPRKGRLQLLGWMAQIWRTGRPGKTATRPARQGHRDRIGGRDPSARRRSDRGASPGHRALLRRRATRVRMNLRPMSTHVRTV